MVEILRFIADNNVGKLAKWLRMVGFDTESFNGADDSEMVATAQAENRIILTRDTGVIERRLITSGEVKAILIESDRLAQQIRQVRQILNIDNSQFKPLTLCLECNRLLIPRNKAEVKDRIPPYVFQTQEQFVVCPLCNRIYWKGTHWQSIQQKITHFNDGV
jgi:uncharacterized protein with PIN domain